MNSFSFAGLTGTVELIKNWKWPEPRGVPMSALCGREAGWSDDDGDGDGFLISLWDLRLFGCLSSAWIRLIGCGVVGADVARSFLADFRGSSESVLAKRVVSAFVRLFLLLASTIIITEVNSRSLLAVYIFGHVSPPEIISLAWYQSHTQALLSKRTKLNKFINSPEN